MLWGFLFTATALGLLIVWGLLQIKRVDSVIEQVDKERKNHQATAEK